MVAPTDGGDSETSQYMAISEQLSAARAQITTLQSRLTSGSTDLSNDPTDPDLQILAALKEKLSTSESAIEAAKGILGSNNPKMMAEQANLASIRKQIGEATEKMRQHLKERIATTQDADRFARGRASAGAKSLIAVQGQRARLGELQRDVVFRVRTAQCAGKSGGGGEAEKQADVFGYDGPRQGDAAHRAGVSETASRDSGRDRRRPRARPVACAARGGDRSQGPLSGRSRICGVGPVLGQSRRRATGEGARRRVASRSSTGVSRHDRAPVVNIGLRRTDPKDRKRFGKQFWGNVIGDTRLGQGRVDNRILRASANVDQIELPERVRKSLPLGRRRIRSSSRSWRRAT